MALSGTIADWSFADILQVISAQRKSGTLRVESGDESLVVTVLEGKIVDAAHIQPGRRHSFLRFLVNTGRLDANAARQAFESLKETTEDPVALLEEAALLSDDDLVDAFEAYAQEVVYMVLQWQQGGYEFIAHPVKPRRPSLALGTEGLLIEGMRRIDEWLHITAIVGPATVFQPRAGSTVPPDMPRRERDLLRLIDGLQDVQALLRAAPLTEYELGEALMNLHQWKLIEVTTDGDAAMEILELDLKEIDSEPLWARALRVVSLVCLIAASVVLGFVAAGSDWSPGPSADLVARDEQVVRFALETYQSAAGHYPAGLAELAEQGIALGAAPNHLAYRQHQGGADYSLVPDAERPPWHVRLESLFRAAKHRFKHS